MNDLFLFLGLAKLRLQGPQIINPAIKIIFFIKFHIQLGDHIIEKCRFLLRITYGGENVYRIFQLKQCQSVFFLLVRDYIHQPISQRTKQ